MKWTRTPPNAPGWYWYRGKHWAVIDPVIIEIMGTGHRANSQGDTLSVQVPYMGFDDTLKHFLDEGLGEWAGPIEPPTE